MEPIALHDGRILIVHDEDECRGPHCCIHNPSDHPLRTAPLEWSQELRMMYRVCTHGVAHPDEDALTFKVRTLQLELVEAICSVHIDSCDGCCGEAAA